MIFWGGRRLDLVLTILGREGVKVGDNLYHVISMHPAADFS